MYSHVWDYCILKGIQWKQLSVSVTKLQSSLWALDFSLELVLSVLPPLYFICLFPSQRSWQKLVDHSWKWKCKVGKKWIKLYWELIGGALGLSLSKNKCESVMDQWKCTQIDRALQSWFTVWVTWVATVGSSIFFSSEWVCLKWWGIEG